MTTTPDSPPTVPGPLRSPDARDADHLKLLAIFFFVFGGLNLIGTCVGVVYTIIGIGIAANPDAMSDPNAPEQLPLFMGIGFAGLGVFTVVLTGVFATLNFLTGRALLRRRRRTFCFVVSALNCISVPFGTALGILTILVLQRPSVVALFERS